MCFAFIFFHFEVSVFEDYFELLQTPSIASPIAPKLRTISEAACVIAAKPEARAVRVAQSSRF